jgi:hypothetical protein
VLFLFVQQSLSAIASVATVFLPPAATENRRHLLNRSVNTDSPTLSFLVSSALCVQLLSQEMTAVFQLDAQIATRDSRLTKDATQSLVLDT